MFRKLNFKKNIFFELSRISRLLFLSLLFILGMFCIDRCIYFWGNKQAISPYWHSEICNLVTHAEEIEVLIVGGCRAALNFSPKVIEKKVNLKTFNAGKAAPGIGYMTEFTLISALSYQKPKYVVIVIDSHNLEETLERSRNELVKKTPWVSRVSVKEKKDFIERYDLNRIVYKTGLYAFMGKGDELFRSSIKKIVKRNILIKDGYEPREPDRIFERTLNDKKENQKLVNHMVREFSTTDFSLETYKRMIKLVKEKGAEPILVVAPMHQLYSSDAVNSEVIDIVTNIGKKEAVQTFIYLDNDSNIANKNELWSDTGHLNRLGAEVFSTEFSKDLEKFINKSNDRV